MEKNGEMPKKAIGILAIIGITGVLLTLIFL
jgi:hypothetical protein